jgi:hypothetical protein
VEVDASCQATVDVSILIHDNCCLDPATLNLEVVPSNPTANATFGHFVQDSLQVLGPRDILVNGHVVVSDVRSCRAVLRVDAAAADCTGHRVDTEVDGGSDGVDVLDTIPPMVSSSVALATLWPASHELVDVGFTAAAVDNCDAKVAQTLATAVWSDEPELSISSGMHRARRSGRERRASAARRAGGLRGRPRIPDDDGRDRYVRQSGLRV